MASLEQHTTHMLAVGHLPTSAQFGWMAGEGLDSFRLLRKEGARWVTETRWGVDVGEPPWDLIDDPAVEGALDGSACARRAELRAMGQCSAALVPAGADRVAWVTSSRLGWTPSDSFGAVLDWIPSMGCARADSRLDARASHASTAAHDIRNQISLALLRLEQLEGVTEEESAALRGSLRSGRALCNAFLEGAGSCADVSLRPLLEEEVRGALEASPDCNITVSLRCGARVFAHAPESAIRRFVQNALLNSLNASPEGSQMLVEAVSAGRGALELAVDDQGSGLSRDEVLRAFSHGFSGRGGTGVGSASLIHAAESLNSELKIQTAPGKGTRLSVQVNTARSERPAAILLDMDPILRPRVRVRLEQAGWWVVSTMGVEEAIGGLDRWGALLAVTRRGSCGGPVDRLREVARDLGVEMIEIFDGDDGGGLPLPTGPCPATRSHS